MHHAIIKELLESQAALFRRVNKGDYSSVCYLGARDNEHGTYDENYTNRLRLAYFLLYEHIDSEDIIRNLFLEELKDRETNSFQGIGPVLEILTCLLVKYNQEGNYDCLFERAKSANFDCACGYDPDMEMSADTGECDIYDCISIAIDMGYPETAARLVELWKKNVVEWDKRNYESLIYFHKDINLESENEEPLKALVDIAYEKGTNSDIIGAWRNLIHYYIRFERPEQAYSCFQRLIREGDLQKIYHIRLFEYILEDCMELICLYSEKAGELWEWVRPFAIERADDMFGNLYEKSIRAAKAVNDEFAPELEQQYQLWKERMRL